MSLYCCGFNRKTKEDCEKRENCYRYTELKRYRLEAKGFENGVWIEDKRECDKDPKFFYVPIRKEDEK